MRTYTAVFLPALALSLTLGAAKAETTANARVRAQLAGLPLAFEPNRGQARPGHDFLARGPYYDLLLNRHEAVIVLKTGESGNSAAPGRTLKLRIAGAQDGPGAQALDALPGTINYFIGSHPDRWRAGIPTFGRVQYREVYPGIAIAYYGRRGAIEFDFIVRPGADPRSIRMAVEGAERVEIDRAGNLNMAAGGRSMRLNQPVAYQEIAGARRAVDCRFLLDTDRSVRVALGAYDRGKPLVIDPTLIYSTRLGGTVYGYGQSIVAGSSGNAYVAGSTGSTDFPLVNPEQTSYAGVTAVWIAELSADGGSLIYSTYLGGSGYDVPWSIAVDSTGRATVVGSTNSADFPLKNPLISTLAPNDTDGFVTRLTAAGNALDYSTYLGGSLYDYADSVAVDSSGNAYITGYTCSRNFPTTAGSYQPRHPSGCDSFLTKMGAAGATLVYSTYFGNNSSATAYGVAVDTSFNAYITGYSYGGLPVTAGAAQPVYAGNSDAFVAKLNPAGSALVYSTYLGGPQLDYGYSIAADSGGNAYVTGTTYSSGFPVTAGALQTALAGAADAFIAKLSPTGTKFLYSTYLGGRRYDYVYGIAVDSAGNAIVAGSTDSDNFKTVSALQPSVGGNRASVFATSSQASSWHASDSGLKDVALAISYDSAAPANVLALGQDGAYQSTNGGASWAQVSGLPFPGFFNGLARSLSNSNVAYIYQGFGSVYSSQDGGATWTAAGIPPTLTCGLRVDPRTSTTVYAISGSTCSSPGISLSTDGGLTWTQLPNPGSSTNTVSDLAIHPTSTAILYAATNSGLFRSTNGGQAWTALPISNLVNPIVGQVIVDSMHPANVYAVISGQIWKSTDGAKTWAALAGLNGVTTLAIAPSKTSVLYAGVDGGVGSGGIYASANGGVSWKASAASVANAGFTMIAVHPSNPSVALAGAYPTSNAFVSKINSTGSGLIYSTYLGGSGSYDAAYGVTANIGGDAFVTGVANSSEFPTTAGAFQQANGQVQRSAFIAHISDSTAACSYSAAPAGYFFYSGGGVASFSVVSPSGCTWTAMPSDPAITILRSAASGAGGIDISLAANTGLARTLSVAVGGQTIAIHQAAAGCTYSVSTSALTFPQAGGPLSVTVTTQPDCDWNVTNLPLWLTATSGASGTGSGTVMFEAAPNPFAVTRYAYNLQIATNTLYASETGTSGAAAAPADARPAAQPPFLPSFAAGNSQCRLDPRVCLVPRPH